MSKGKTLTATEFKAKCLKILEDLGPHGVTITKRGRPVARVTPIRSRSLQALFGSMKDQIKIKGDIFSTGIKWDAES